VDAYGRKWKGHVTNLGGGASSILGGMLLKEASREKIMPRFPVRIDFDRPENQDFNAEDLLKLGLSVEPKVRVRWLPRTGTPAPRLTVKDPARNRQRQLHGVAPVLWSLGR